MSEISDGTREERILQAADRLANALVGLARVPYSGMKEDLSLGLALALELLLDEIACAGDGAR